MTIRESAACDPSAAPPGTSLFSAKVTRLRCCKSARGFGTAVVFEEHKVK